MPAAKPSTETDTHVILPCVGNSDFKGCERCMQACMNCRREVKASLTRVAGRKLRKLRALPTCSVEKCAAFLTSVDNKPLRLHLSSMAWWRFSAEDSSGSSEPLRKIMAACPPIAPEFGEEYLHMAVKELSRLSQEQISAWFGCDDVYQIAALFSGDLPEMTGSHCSKCKLYKLGCTIHGTLSSEECTLWRDKFIQSVAESVKKNGMWRNPCGSMK